MKVSGLILILSVSIPAGVKADTGDDAGKLMTFFTTKIERNVLDDMRKAGKFDHDKALSGSQPIVVKKPNILEVKGIVLREKARPVVWVNNANTLKSDHIDQKINVKTPSINKQLLNIPVVVNQKRVTLKPGQQWHEVDNTVRDKFQTR